MQDQAVRLLTNLLGIYSPSGKEGDIANFLAEEMKKFGFQVGIDAIGNVIGVVGEGEPTIFLCGHMDTIAGRLPVRVENNKVYGAGAVDARGRERQALRPGAGCRVPVRPAGEGARRMSYPCPWWLGHYSLRVDVRGLPSDTRRGGSLGVA